MTLATTNLPSIIALPRFFPKSIFISAILLSGCGQESAATDCAAATKTSDAAITWGMAFPSLPPIAAPTALFQLPTSNQELYVLKQQGSIARFANQSNVTDMTEVLNIQDRIYRGKNSGGETGLLGVAVHPQFADNRYVFIYYTGKSASNELESRVARYTMTADNQFDKNSELIILRITRPFENHVGGHLAFDQQGYLYIGSGDGGSAGDPGERGQNNNLLLGKILRIDINTPSEEKNYSIPSDNPFLGVANTRAEIWAWGLRNPWRFSFDSLTHELWAADVGQNTWEEINIIKKGGNYGWGDMEGNTCFRDRPNCSTANKIKPIYVVNHNTGACSITGGYVYRGAQYPQVYGKYFFTDFCDNTMRSIEYKSGEKVSEQSYSSLLKDVLQRSSVAKNIVAFAEDNQHELYAIGHADGTGKQIYKMQSKDSKQNASLEKTTPVTCNTEDKK